MLGCYALCLLKKLKTGLLLIMYKLLFMRNATDYVKRKSATGYVKGKRATENFKPLVLLII